MTTVNDTKVDLDDHPAGTVDSADAIETVAADTVDTAAVAAGDAGDATAEPGSEPDAVPRVQETPEAPDAPGPPEVPAASDAAGAPARRTHRLAVLLVVAAVAVGGLGAWFVTEAAATRSSAASRNTALVDTGTTAEVSAAVTNSLNKVFSYSYDKPEVTERAAAEALRGPALDTYDRLFAQVRELAPQQKIVLTTRVVHLAVQSITGQRAQLLVFLDQSATRADNNTTSTGAAQLSVTAERDGDTWVIIDLTPR